MLANELALDNPQKFINKPLSEKNDLLKVTKKRKDALNVDF
jgi:hypothetical protein